jgi:hypothetical protein
LSHVLHFQARIMSYTDNRVGRAFAALGTERTYTPEFPELLRNCESALNEANLVLEAMRPIMIIVRSITSASGRESLSELIAIYTRTVDAAYSVVDEHEAIQGAGVRMTRRHTL